MRIIFPGERVVEIGRAAFVVEDFGVAAPHNLVRGSQNRPEDVVLSLVELVAVVHPDAAKEREASILPAAILVHGAQRVGGVDGVQTRSRCSNRIGQLARINVGLLDDCENDARSTVNASIAPFELRALGDASNLFKQHCTLFVSVNRDLLELVDDNPRVWSQST